MNEYERFALSQFLSEYPEDKTFHEILEMIEDSENDDVLLFDPFYYIEPEVLTEIISELAYSLRDEFVSRITLQREIALALVNRKNTQ